MVDTQELVPPPRSPLNLDIEIGSEITHAYNNLFHELKIAVDPKFINPLALSQFEISSRVLSREKVAPVEDLNISLTELRFQVEQTKDGALPEDSFDKFLNSWSHYLLTGEHLLNETDLIKFSKTGKAYANKIIKSLSFNESVTVSELNNLSLAALFLSLSGLQKPSEMGYLKGLKRQLIYAGRHLIKEPNVNNDEDQIAILSAYSNYVLANAKVIKVSEQGDIELTY